MKMHTFDHTRLIAQNAARPRNLLQSLLWTRHDTPSLEHGRLYEHHAGFILDGTVVGSLDHHPSIAPMRLPLQTNGRPES
ncbi:hypothetical protein [Paenibacillus sp. JCM 10914]|uniref:hypothetical protein n=1 Tax=Paenibacillus sp. JCM 10914 TaxID=1236974 RepID=UPI000ADA121C|nr:hypothetical protein [Paenibacillus sp. JCM 10914]